MKTISGRLLALLTAWLAALYSPAVAEIAAPGSSLVAVDWSQAERLEEGVELCQWNLTTPRPLAIHCVRIDSTHPGISFHTTGRYADWEDGQRETRRQTVCRFMTELRGQDIPLVLAINADAFSPWPAPYAAEDPADLLGLAVSSGQLVSSPSGTPSLIVERESQLSIRVLHPGDTWTGIQVAVSGFGLCLEQGRVIAGGDDLHPRTGFGLCRDNRWLFLMTIDGRQPSSWGATTGELGQLLRDCGAWQAINMDGGGSTTLAVWRADSPNAGRCQLLNQPVGNGLDQRNRSPKNFRPSERANGNNFGVSVHPPRPQ